MSEQFFSTPIEIGMISEKYFFVTENFSAKTMGSGTLNVLATPALISFFENVAMTLLENHLASENLSTVGIAIDVKHTAATLLQKKICVKVSVKKIDGRKISFELHAFEDEKEIAHGTHDRFIIQKEKFLKKLHNQ